MSNTNAALDHIRSMILTDIERSKGAGRETLEAFVRIGERLREAKEMIGTETKGAFGAWCEGNFPFSKEWRARLMKLAAEWPTILRVMDALEAKGKVLGRKEFSVDGALALVAAFCKEYPDDAAAMGLGEKVEAAKEQAAKAEQRKAERESAKAETMTEAERLRAMLAEAMERIRVLEAELSRAKGKGPKGNAKADDAAGPKGNAPGPNVDKATATRARKVAEMALRPGHYGEALAAWERLREMAAKAGADMEAFLTACGIDVAALTAAVAKAMAEKQAADEADKAAA